MRRSTCLIMRSSFTRLFTADSIADDEIKVNTGNDAHPDNTVVLFYHFLAFSYGLGNIEITNSTNGSAASSLSQTQCTHLIWWAKSREVIDCWFSGRIWGKYETSIRRDGEPEAKRKNSHFGSGKQRRLLLLLIWRYLTSVTRALLYIVLLWWLNFCQKKCVNTWWNLS